MRTKLRLLYRFLPVVSHSIRDLEPRFLLGERTYRKLGNLCHSRCIHSFLIRSQYHLLPFFRGWHQPRDIVRVRCQDFQSLLILALVQGDRITLTNRIALISSSASQLIRRILWRTQAHCWEIVPRALMAVSWLWNYICVPLNRSRCLSRSRCWLWWFFSCMVSLYILGISRCWYLTRWLSWDWRLPLWHRPFNRRDKESSVPPRSLSDDTALAF